jgi:hypothetical protein
MPKADLVLIASSRDGKPDGFLDAAHDVWPAPNATQDVPSVQAIIDNIQGQFNKTGKPVSVILVGTGYGSQLIVGNSYFWSPDNTDPANATPKLIAACSGEISSIQIMVANGSQKADTFQGLADGLLAPVNAYPGRVAVGGNPVSFLVPVGTPIHTWTPR